MTEPHDVRGRRVLLWVGLILLIVAAFALPEEWLAPITSFLGGEESTSAFTDEVAALDAKLEERSARLTPDRARQLVPHVVARRLLRAGPMTAEETRKAAAIWANAMRAAANEPADGSVDAHYELARRRIVEEFPRLDADRVAEELERVREQTGRALRAPGGGGVGTVGMDCGECHRKTRPLPDGQTFDVVGIYPLMAGREEFDGGRRLPVLAESLELEAQARLVGGDEGSCLTCHTPHDTRGFEITEKDRVENMGLWVNVIETDPGILHLQVKVKNADSGHRAPAGRPTSAYVTTVEAFQHGRPLSPRYGQRLPPHLRTDAYALGSVFARHMVDTAGTVTTDLGDVADLKFDSRLLSGRFDGEDFVFDRFDGSAARVRVTLWYLPDYSTWKNASAIRRADKKDR